MPIEALLHILQTPSMPTRRSSYVSCAYGNGTIKLDRHGTIRSLLLYLIQCRSALANPRRSSNSKAPRHEAGNLRRCHATMLIDRDEAH
jgi:hypothetical protein